MNKTTYSLFLFAFLLTASASAQTVIDGLRLARLQSGGTARSVATGGALSAFGGDFGTLSVNPAGVATFRSSTFVVTPSLDIASTTADFLENGLEQVKTGIHLNNIGLVFTRVKPNSDWKTVNFAIGMNKLTQQAQDFSYSGTSLGTIAQRWKAFADGKLPDDLYAFEERIAYDAGILYQPQNTPADEYLIDPDGSVPLYKEQTVTRTGSVNDLNFTLGGNYMHKLYVGVTVGLPIVRFEEFKSYTETDENGISTEFNAMTFEERLNTTGVGVNAKLGLIYRANQALRLGLAFHSPTFFSLSDQFDTSIEADLTIDGSRDTYTAESPFSTFSYRFASPWRAVGSVGLMLGKFGFISGDLEYVNYATSRFEMAEDRVLEQDLNTEIGEILNSAINLRLGGELRYGVFAVRGGAGYMMSPYLSEVYTGLDEGQLSLSFGLGLREKGFFLDLGIARHSFSETYRPYTIPNSELSPEVLNTVSRTQFVGSIGFRF